MFEIKLLYQSKVLHVHTRKKHLVCKHWKYIRCFLMAVFFLYSRGQNSLQTNLNFKWCNQKMYVRKNKSKLFVAVRFRAITFYPICYMKTPVSVQGRLLNRWQHNHLSFFREQHKQSFSRARWSGWVQKGTQLCFTVQNVLPFLSSLKKTWLVWLLKWFIGSLFFCLFVLIYLTINNVYLYF